MYEAVYETVVETLRKLWLSCLQDFGLDDSLLLFRVTYKWAGIDTSCWHTRNIFVGNTSLCPLYVYIKWLRASDQMRPGVQWWRSFTMAETNLYRPVGTWRDLVGPASFCAPNDIFIRDAKQKQQEQQTNDNKINREHQWELNVMLRQAMRARRFVSSLLWLMVKIFSFVLNAKLSFSTTNQRHYFPCWTTTSSVVLKKRTWVCVE